MAFAVAPVELTHVKILADSTEILGEGDCNQMRNSSSVPGIGGFPRTARRMLLKGRVRSALSWQTRSNPSIAYLGANRIFSDHHSETDDNTGKTWRAAHVPFPWYF